MLLHFSIPIQCGTSPSHLDFNNLLFKCESLPNGRNGQVKQHISGKTHKYDALRFWVGVWCQVFLCGVLVAQLMKIYPVFIPLDLHNKVN